MWMYVIVEHEYKRLSIHVKRLEFFAVTLCSGAGSNVVVAAFRTDDNGFESLPGF
jgi:hypothetical protein